MFTTYALQGLATRTKGVYTREELAPLAQTNVESLKEFNFFTFAKADGKKEKFLEPVDYFLEYKDSALTLHFTLPLKAPVKPKQLALDVFDPAFFIDFKFEEKDPVKLVGAPASCQMKFQRPGEADVKKLTEEMVASGDQSKRDVYEVTLDAAGLKGITAICLEVLPDARLPKRGPGRVSYEGPSGDFFLSEITLRPATALPLPLGEGRGEGAAKFASAIQSHANGNNTAAAFTVDCTIHHATP